MIEVFTPTGFQKFDGVIKKTSDAQLYNGVWCSPNHKIKIDGEFVEVEDLSTSAVSHNVDLYDLLNVENGNEYYTNEFISHNCLFYGSSDTLISGKAQARMTFKDPINHDDNREVMIYEKPDPDGKYILCSDVSEGIGKDYSTIQVIRIDCMPYRQVFVFHKNDISPWDLPGIVKGVAEKYNEAYVLVENNSIGKIVADQLADELEYENVLSSKTDKSNDILVEFTFQNTGIKMNKRTKMIGCSSLKQIVEDNILQITDWDTIQEFSTFIKQGTSYAAKKGKHDDLIMPLVAFGWLVTSPLFEEINNTDLSTLVADRKKRKEELEEDSHECFGFMDDGTGIDAFADM